MYNVYSINTMQVKAINVVSALPNVYLLTLAWYLAVRQYKNDIIKYFYAAPYQTLA